MYLIILITTVYESAQTASVSRGSLALSALGLDRYLLLTALMTPMLHWLTECCCSLGSGADEGGGWGRGLQWHLRLPQRQWQRHHDERQLPLRHQARQAQLPHQIRWPVSLSQSYTSWSSGTERLLSSHLEYSLRFWNIKMKYSSSHLTNFCTQIFDIAVEKELWPLATVEVGGAGMLWFLTSCIIGKCFGRKGSCLLPPVGEVVVEV